MLTNKNLKSAMVTDKDKYVAATVCIKLEAHLGWQTSVVVWCMCALAHVKI